MNSFQSSKNKLKFVHDQNIINKQNIANQQTTNDLAIKKTSINLGNSYLFKKELSYSTSWEALDITDSTLYQYKTWEIELNSFDIRLLPFIDIKVLYRFNGGNTIDSFNPFPYIGKSFLIYNVDDSSNYKRVKCVVSLYLSAYSVSYPYEAKLNIFFTNPREYR